MKLCNQHLERLKSAIKYHGLWDMVSADHEDFMKKINLAKKMERSIPENFDPYFYAFQLIVNNGLNAFGPALLAVPAAPGPDEPYPNDGHFCPVCLAEVFSPKDNWIEHAALAAAELAIEISDSSKSVDGEESEPQS